MAVLRKTEIKKNICLLLIIIMVMVLPGCWSKAEPKDISIINSSFYDVQDGIYEAVVEVMNPSGAAGTQQAASTNENPYIIFSGEGPSLVEALNDLTVSLDRTLFAGQNQTRFFSERFAKTSMRIALEYFTREHQTSETPLVIIVKGENPKDIYNCQIGLANTTGDYFNSLQKHQPNTISNSVFVTLINFIKDYYIEGKQPVAGVAEVLPCELKQPGSSASGSQGSQAGRANLANAQNKIRYEGLAAFKNGSLVGFMNGTETRAYNIITGNDKESYVSVASGDGQAVVKIIKSTADIKTAFKSGEAVLDVKIKCTTGIVQESGTTEISKIGGAKTVEQSVNKQLLTEIAQSVKKAQQEFQSDIFGFGTYMHAQHPDKWKEIRENWDDYFSKATVNISVESSVIRSGEIKEPFIIKDKML
ncbi:MAG: Ger(x)C family spore germination protein [Christensenellales bacterium]|jgi:spore germination protein KC